jgi:hypothetical protein
MIYYVASDTAAAIINLRRVRKFALPRKSAESTTSSSHSINSTDSLPCAITLFVG